MGSVGPTTRALAALASSAALLSGCTTKQPETETYFDRTIRPILQDSCVSTNTGANCHVADAKGNALGNLSLESYRDLAKRRDQLVDYGPYGQPNLLLKNIEPYPIRLTTHDGAVVSITTDVRHAGGAALGVTSAGFATLERWIHDGAQENNGAVQATTVTQDPCVENVLADPGFDPTKDPATPDFAEFRSSVQPLLGKSCAAGNCHGAPSNSLYLVCAESASGDAAKSAVLARWNYFAAGRYVAADPGASELLKRPLDPAQGGAYHGGGVIYRSQSEPEWTTLRDWAKAHGPASFPQTKGFAFFGHRVQPILVKKGCMTIGCHSPAMFHDYRIRGGGSGSFSVATTITNYDLSIFQLGLESPDPNASRIIAKNLPRPDQVAGGRGITHRGGPLLADFGAGLPTIDQCDLDAAENGDLDRQPAYCVLARWLQIERAERALAPLSGVVYVRRPPAPLPDRPQDWMTYAPGADLCVTPLSQDPATGAITAGGSGCTSLLAGCGLDPKTADVRHPAVSWNGQTIAFAARSSDAEPFAVWTVKPDGSACARQPDIALPPQDDQGQPVPDNGAPIHDFDPAWAPDGRLVFASTRGNVMNGGSFDYKGPQRTPADPSRWNTNLYAVDGPGKIRQLTFVLNQELLPSFMSDGRVIFTAEKRTPGFYQLAGRRENLDGGDYHPLFASRRTIGFSQMTEVVELANRNFAAVFSDEKAAHGAGTLGVFNRSIGIDQHSPDAADYVVDPGALSYLDPKFYLHSLGLPDPAATGHVDGKNQGAYRSPTPLPDGNLLVSYAADAGDLSSFSGNFDLWIVDSITGQRLAQITSDQDTDEIFAAAIYERANRGVFASRFDEPNGHTKVYSPGEDAAFPTDRADITMLDAPMIASLLFQNTRTGRPIPDLSGGVDVWEDVPPTLAESSFAAADPRYVTTDAYGQVYAHRRLLGPVTVYGDASAHLAIPGGAPMIFAGSFALDGAPAAYHFQREEMQFYPGEYSHQSFQRRFFNGFCGGCHGSISGREDDVAIAPDLLTEASRIDARGTAPDLLTKPPASRMPDRGPPF